MRKARRNNGKGKEYYERRRRELKWRIAYIAVPEGEWWRVARVVGGIGGYAITDHPPFLSENDAVRVAKNLTAEQMLSDNDVDIIVGSTFGPAGKCVWCKKKITPTEAGFRAHIPCGMV